MYEILSFNLFFITNQIFSSLDCKKKSKRIHRKNFTNVRNRSGKTEEKKSRYHHWSKRWQHSFRFDRHNYNSDLHQKKESGMDRFHSQKFSWLGRTTCREGYSEKS